MYYQRPSICIYPEYTLARIIHKIGTSTGDRVFERFFLPKSNTIYKNKEAKASEGGTTENERKYFILSSIRKIYE